MQIVYALGKSIQRHIKVIVHREKFFYISAKKGIPELQKSKICLKKLRKFLENVKKKF